MIQDPESERESHGSPHPAHAGEQGGANPPSTSLRLPARRADPHVWAHRALRALRALRMLRELRPNARRYLYAVIFLGLAWALNSLLLNFYLVAVHAGSELIGSVNAIPAAASVVVGLPAGMLADRIGRVRALILGGLLAFAGMLVLALTGQPAVLVISAAAFGIGQAVLQVVGVPFMAENTTAQQRAFYFSLEAALMTGIGFIGSLIGGSLPALFAALGAPNASGVTALRLAMVATALVQGAAVLPLLLLREPAAPVAPAGRAPTRDTETAEAEGLADVPDAGLWLRMQLVLPQAAVGLGAGLVIPFLNIYIQWRFGISYAALGVLFGVSELATAAAILLQPLLAARLGKMRSVVVVQASSLPFLIALGFSPFFALVAVALFVRGALMNMANPIYNAFAMEQLSARQRATVAGLLSAAWGLGWAVGSWLSGWLRQPSVLGTAAGFNVVFAGMALLYASSFVMQWLFFVRRPRHALTIAA